MKSTYFCSRGTRSFYTSIESISSQLFPKHRQNFFPPIGLVKSRRSPEPKTELWGGPIQNNSEKVRGSALLRKRVGMIAPRKCLTFLRDLTVGCSIFMVSPRIAERISHQPKTEMRRRRR